MKDGNGNEGVLPRNDDIRKDGIKKDLETRVKELEDKLVTKDSFLNAIQKLVEQIQNDKNEQVKSLQAIFEKTSEGIGLLNKANASLLARISDLENSNDSMKNTINNLEKEVEGLKKNKTVFQTFKEPKKEEQAPSLETMKDLRREMIKITNEVERKANNF